MVPSSPLRSLRSQAAFPRASAAHWLQFIAARLTASALTSFDVEANLRTAEIVAGAAYRLDRRHRHRVMRQLALAFPQWSVSRRDKICRGSFTHCLQLAVEMCHTPRLVHRDSWAQRASFTDLGPLLEILNAGRPAILVTGHVGNWEVLAYSMAVLGYPMHAIYRPLDNPLMNHWLVTLREKTGLRLIPKLGSTDRMKEVLSDGGILGLVADQNAGEKGVFVPFFGHLASTYKSVGLLATRHNLPVLCGHARRRPPGFGFELKLEDAIHPEDWAAQADPVYYVTARFMRAIERMVNHCPEQYIWFQRRWRSRPAFERRGQPMPAALRDRLEALPWMDQAMMDRLQVPVADA